MQGEVSKPVLVGAIVAAVLVVGLLGWYFLGRTQKYAGYQAPAPSMQQGQIPPEGIPGMSPAMMPGANTGQGAGTSGQPSGTGQ